MQRDLDVQKRIEKLEKMIFDEDTISRLERRVIRIGMLLISILTLLLVMASKLSDLIHAIKEVW